MKKWIFIKKSLPKLFDPKNLAGLLFWCDISQEPVQADNTSMTGLTDFSGNGLNLTVSGTAPVYRTDQLEGMPTVQFNSSGFFTRSTWLSPGFPFRFDPLAVVGLVRWSSSGYFVTFTSGTRLASYGFTDQFYNSLSGSFRHLFTMEGFSTIQGFSSSSANAYHILCSNKDENGIASLRRNGTNLSSTDIRTNPNTYDSLTSLHTNLSNVRYSGFHIGRPNVTNEGRISEICLYNRTLELVEREKLEGYLAHKWGRISSLPSNHPYKNSPPTA